MKSQKVIALLLSTALSISTCVPLGSITALGAEAGTTAQAVEVQEEVSDLSENQESLQEEDSVETEPAEEAAAEETVFEEEQEAASEETSTEKTEDTENVTAEVGDAETESVDESEAAVSAQEAETSGAADNTGNDETAAPIADTPEKENAQDSLADPDEASPADFQNNLQAYSEDAESEYNTLRYITTAYNTSADLSVWVRANDMSQLTYQWFKDGSLINGADSTSYTTDSVTESTYYEFRVSDQYGNSAFCEFYVNVENHLEAYTANTSYEGTSTSPRIYVAPNTPADLKVAVTADDMTGLTYQWYKDDTPIEGADSTVYSIDSVTSPVLYCFKVTDRYNSTKKVDFEVYVDNQLKVKPVGEIVFDDAQHIYASPGSSVSLHAAVSANDTSQLVYEWYDNNNTLIDGEDSDSYTVDSITLDSEYRLQVTDQYGNIANAYFSIFLDNHLTAKAENIGSGTSLHSRLNVAFGDSVNLKAIVTADDMTELTCQWYDEDSAPIEGADSTSYHIESVTKAQEYTFKVRDQYGKTVSVQFDIYVENHLTAYPEGEDSHVSYKYISVVPGSSVEMKAVVSADDTSNLSYKWYRDYINVVTEGVDTTSCTVDSITEAETYLFEVRDQYGNRKSIEFFIKPDNGLTAYPEGAENGRSYVNVSGAPGTSLDLKVVASAMDMADMTYEWSVDGETIDGAVSSSYTVNPVTTKQEYKCKVTDQYGNYKTVYFYVSVENHMIVSPEGIQDDEDSSGVFVYVASGQPAELKLSVSADDTSRLTYKWYDNADDTIIDGINSSSFTTEPITQKHEYRCIVSDQYGNEKSIDFFVYPVDYSNLQTINVGDSQKVYVSEDSPYEIFEFTPAETGGYMIYSSDTNTDPYIEVFNDSYDRLFYHNDIHEDERNFKLTKVFTAGTTYIIGVRARYIWENGTFVVHLEKTEGLTQPQVIAAEGEMSLVYGNSGTISVSGAQSELNFTSSDPSIVSVDSTGKVTANKVGTADITVFAEATDTYDQSNSITVTVTVTGASVDNAIVSGIEDKTYSGAAQTQSPVVNLGSAVLTEGTDYTLSYSNNVNIGTATVTITGISNYQGSISKNFAIGPALISTATVTGLAAKTYTGKAITQTPVVKIGDITLVSGKDYTISYSNNTNAGTATVTITGTGSYTGAKTVTFKINKAAQSITVKSSAASIAVGKTATVSITGNKGTKSFKSSNTAVATVNAAGTVVARKVGTVTITATSAATANYNAASKAVTIKVVPAATASITAANQATGIKLTWKKVAGATGYKVYRGATLIKTIKSGATVTCTDTKANTNGTKYIFKVIPTASTGNGLAKTLTTYRVARPAISSLTSSAAKKMTVKWKKNAKAKGYQIQYSASSGFKSGNKTITISNASTVSKTIGSLATGKNYFVRIRTYKSVSGKKYFSAWSIVKKVYIKKSTATKTTKSTTSGNAYIGNRNSKIFHHSWCSSVKRMNNSNKVKFGSRNDAASKGYKPCKICKP